MALLFSSFTIGKMQLKNRIVMSPMCMYSVMAEDGKVTDWHLVHYGSRAVGQAGLIILEATAVTPQGRISTRDLGIWEDGHVEGLRRIVDLVHGQDAKIGIQLAHAGRKARVPGPIIAPSEIPFEGMPVPNAMTLKQIEQVIEAFALGARRAKQAGFDVIEIHAAHGYLINQFLSPLSNKRTDEFGGSHRKRFELLRRVTEAVKQEWDGPLFVRLSVNEYHEEGNSVKDMVEYARMLKELGVDLIDCSSGGVVPANIQPEPGYQVPYSEMIRREVGIATGAVGLITGGPQAEQILQDNKADLIFIGRAFLSDPYWPRSAANVLGVRLLPPKQYERGW